MFPNDIAFTTQLADSPQGCRSGFLMSTLHLYQDLAAGRNPPLITSTWLVDFQAASFGGQVPTAALPRLSANFPLVIAQNVPPDSGGGMRVIIWLWDKEHEELLRLVPEL